MKQETQGKTKADIHDFDKRLKSVFKRLNSELSPENMLLVNRYYNAMIIDTAGKAVQEKHLQTILSLSRMYGGNWQDVTKNDIDNLIVEIAKKYSNEKGQETHTSYDYKKILKIFVRWIKTGYRRKNPDLQEPIEVRNIRLRRVKDRLSRENLITEADINKIVHACGENVRDKAFITVHSEAGTRIGETLTLQIKHVMIDTMGAIIKVDGKTNARPIRLVKSLPYLASWLNAHPFRNNPESPLWINLSHHGYGDQLSYEGVSNILAKRVKMAGLEKRVFFHLFRHSEITETANYLTEAQLRKRHGWSGSSKMPERYTHLIDSDVDKAVLGHYGLIKKEERVTAQLPKICNVCEFPNAFDSTFCSKCFKPLDLKTAIELEEKEKSKISELENIIKQERESRHKKDEEIEQKIKDQETQSTERYLEWQSKIMKKMDELGLGDR
ncbi:MAG TPA: tyrosine-type recombinase/integrase [Candidatus Nitrosotalea sp.]|nr:tyrosine-type recombinase/integrase [Candidatus Nitrosotalea sp.]